MQLLCSNCKACRQTCLTAGPAAAAMGDDRSHSSGRREAEADEGLRDGQEPDEQQALVPHGGSQPEQPEQPTAQLTSAAQEGAQLG